MKKKNSLSRGYEGKGKEYRKELPMLSDTNLVSFRRME
jgi:hypothetical protein